MVKNNKKIKANLTFISRSPPIPSPSKKSSSSRRNRRNRQIRLPEWFLKKRIGKYLKKNKKNQQK